MKLWQKILVIIGSTFLLLTFLRVVGQGTGILGIYTIPSNANTPAIGVGESIVVSNLKEVSNLDFVAYKYIFDNFNKDSTNLTEEIWIHRLVAKEGDEVIIKNNRAIVNGKAIDKDLNLKMAYSTDYYGFTNIMNLFKIEKEDFYPLSKDAFIVYLSDRDSSKIPKSLKLTPFESNRSEGLAEVFKKKSWTADNFGPFIVPEGKIFVLGDNRQNAMDSRYIGFIPAKDIVGVKL